MNINLLNHANHIETGLYLDTLLENSFLPLINLTTRIAVFSATLLDHIVTNIADDTYDSGIILSDISEHFPVFIFVTLKTNLRKLILQKHFENN